MIADLANRLRDEARRANERRLLVLAGEREACYAAAADAIDGAGVPPLETTMVTTEEGIGADFSDSEHITPRRADALLGTTRTAVVLDCHDECRPNALGRTVGAVDGGGLVVLCTPSLDAWPARQDDFDETLAVPPFDGEAVGGRDCLTGDDLVDAIVAGDVDRHRDHEGENDSGRAETCKQGVDTTGAPWPARTLVELVGQIDELVGADPALVARRGRSMNVGGTANGDVVAPPTPAVGSVGGQPMSPRAVDVATPQRADAVAPA